MLVPHPCRVLICVAMLGPLSGCGPALQAPPSAPQQSAPQQSAPAAPMPAEPLPRTAAAPLATYVLLAQSASGAPVAYARVIVGSGEACPALQGAPGSADLLMTKRRNPHGFAVDVCEAQVAFGESRTVSGTATTLPVARRQVRRVAVVGDTGCKPGDDHQGDCSPSDPYWPFASLTSDAAGRQPDLVVHVGDYNYRGTPSGFTDADGDHQWYYDAGDGAEASEQCGLADVYYSQNSTGNADRDAWPAWRDDFFAPAADLLTAAPWVLARGNHELCSHAGPGWFYFLDGGSDLPGGSGQVSCPDQGRSGTVESHLVLSPPRVIALQDLELAVLDSSNACDELDNFASEYARQLTAVAGTLSATPAWWVGHRPPWGVDHEYGSGEEAAPYQCDNSPGTGPKLTYAAINRTLQCALASPSGGGASSSTVADLLLPKLALVLSGHMHRYESLTFAASTGRPPSLIVGNGGVMEDSGPPQGTFRGTVDGATASGQAVEQFGYLLLERDAAGTWSGKVVSPSPADWQPTLASCGGGTPAAVGDSSAGEPGAGGAVMPALCVEGLAAGG